MLKKSLVFVSTGAIFFCVWKNLRSCRRKLSFLQSESAKLKKNIEKNNINQKLYEALFNEYKKKRTGEHQGLIIDKLNKKNTHSIIIYGFGISGRLLYEILKDEPIEIKAFVDINPSIGEYHGIPICTMENLENIGEADCIIVTPVYYYDSILDNLFASGRDEEILSLKEFVHLV